MKQTWKLFHTNTLCTPAAPFCKYCYGGIPKKKSPIKRKKAHKIENSAPYRAIAAMRKKPPHVAPNAELKVLEKCTKNLIGHSRLAFNNHESNIDC